jgi:hypothetical protein
MTTAKTIVAPTSIPHQRFAMSCAAGLAGASVDCSEPHAAAARASGATRRTAAQRLVLGTDARPLRRPRRKRTTEGRADERMELRYPLN